MDPRVLLRGLGLDALRGFTTRLRSRKVVQWTVAYVAGAWVVLQGSDIVAAQFGWPVALQRAITVALVTGVFVTVIVAWYHGERGRQRPTGVEVLLVGLVLAGGAVSFMVVGRDDVDDRGGAVEAAAHLPSIAVLPFEHRSSDPGDLFFTQGIHDEILTRLANIGGLGVISRTSVMPYGRTRKTVPEIAGELGAGYLVEGAVQRAGSQVRVHAQLVDAEDRHLWAESFDRPLTVENLLAIQTEIATSIARALHAAVSPDEIERIQELPTRSVQAYEHYLQGTVHLDRQRFVDDARAAVHALERAVAEDPEFATAFALLAYARLVLYSLHPGHRDEVARARIALDRAISLAPGAARTHWARGVYASLAERDVPAALEHYQTAHRLDPNLGGNAIALALRRLGRWDEAVEAFRRVIVRDPRNPTPIGRLGGTLGQMGRAVEGLAYVDRALAIFHSPELFYRSKILAELQVAGDTSRLAELYEELDGHRHIQWVGGYLRGRYRETVENHRPDFGFEASFVNYFLPMPGFFLDPVVAAAYTDSLRWVGERYLLGSESGWGPPDDVVAGDGHAALALHHALSGRREDAIREARSAVQRVPMSREAIEGHRLRRALADVLVLVGEHDAALGELELLVTTPGMVQPHWLRVDPFYEPLRTDPRFRAIAGMEAGR